MARFRPDPVTDPGRMVPLIGPGASRRLLVRLLIAMLLCAQGAGPVTATHVPGLNVFLEPDSYNVTPWGLARNRDTRCRDSRGCFSMAQLSASTADQFGVSTEITVSSAAELNAALTNAPDGATIRLLAGDYGSLDLRDGPRDLTLVADRDAPAVVREMSLIDVQGLTIDGLVFDYQSEAGTPVHYVPFAISRSQDITIRNALFDGDDAFGTGTVADGYGTGSGLNIWAGTGIVLENNEITGFWKGVRISASEDVVLRGNDFNDMRSDALSISTITNMLIEGNHFHDMREAPGSGDHNDMIQLMSSGAETPTTGLTIRDNVFNIAGGTGTQSVFLKNASVLEGAGDTMFYRDIVIENNLIINDYKNGIVVGQVDGLTVRNNTVLPETPPVDGTKAVNIPIITVHPDSRNVVISDNVTTAVGGYEGQADWTVSDNVLVRNGLRDAENHYTALFTDPTGDYALDLAKLTVRPDSVLAEQGIGTSLLQYTDTTETLTPRITSEQQTDNRAIYVFDASLTTGPAGPVDAGMADFLWTFSDGTTAQGVQVAHQFAAPGAHTATLTVTMADGTHASSETVASIRDSTVVSFDAAAGTLVMHGLDGMQTLAQAPLIDDPTVSGRLLDLSALDSTINLPASLLRPMREAGHLEIDMRIAGLPDNTGSGEIMRQHQAFTFSVKDGELIFSMNQVDAGWTGVKSSGADLGNGMWRDVTVVHDAEAARLEIWIDGHLNAVNEGVGAMETNSRGVSLGGAFSNTAFDAVLERLEFRTDPDAYDFADPAPRQDPVDDPVAEDPGSAPADDDTLPGQQDPVDDPVAEDPGSTPADDDTLPGQQDPGSTPVDDAALPGRPDLDTLRAAIEAGESPLSLREATPGSVDIWADRSGSLLVGEDSQWERFRDRADDDVMHGGTGADQFVFDMRHMQAAQTDRILDLDFGAADVLRFLPPDGATQLWLKSEADILQAVGRDLLTAEINTDASALELRLTALPQHVVEIDLHDGFVWTALA